MKRLSFWAHNHKVAARIIIVFIYFFLNLLGLFGGDLLSSLNIALSPAFYFIPILLTLGGILFYPSKKRKHLYKNFYYRQKFADGLLIVATFLFIAYTGNSFNYTRTINLNSAFAISIVKSPVSSSIVPDNSLAGKKNGQLSKKANKKHLRFVIKEIRKKYKATSNSGKTIYIMLVVLGALFLSFLMLGLACNIACSGSEALAYIVGFVGIGAIIFGAVKLIQRITRGKSGKTQTVSEPAK